MESGSGPQSPNPGFGPGSPGYGPGAERDGPQSPGPQAPGLGARVPSPPSPQAPEAPVDPQSPGGGIQSPAPEGAVPPGGFQHPPGQMATQGELAGWGSRVGATVLDFLIIIIPAGILIALVVGLAFSSETGALILGVVSVLLFFLVSLFYAPVLMARQGEKNGQTFGRQIVGIRAVRDNGQAFSLGSAIVREFVVKGLLFGTAGSFLFYIPTVVDWLWPLWDDENRCLHDMVVSTHVVRA